MAIVRPNQEAEQVSDSAEVGEVRAGFGTHADLVMRAEKWLKQQGCGVTIRDPFRAPRIRKDT